MTTNAVGTKGQSWVRYDSAAYEAGVAIAGDKLGSVGGHLKKSASAEMWILVFDSATLPANDATNFVLMPVNVQPGLESMINFGTKTFANGIFIVLSTTDDKLTLDTSNSGRLMALEG